MAKTAPLMQEIGLIPGWGTRSHMPQLQIPQQRSSATAKQIKTDIRRKNKKPKCTVVACYPMADTLVSFLLCSTLR